MVLLFGGEANKICVKISGKMGAISGGGGKGPFGQAPEEIYVGAKQSEIVTICYPEHRPIASPADADYPGCR